MKAGRLRDRMNTGRHVVNRLLVLHPGVISVNDPDEIHMAVLTSKVDSVHLLPVTLSPEIQFYRFSFSPWTEQNHEQCGLKENDPQREWHY